MESPPLPEQVTIGARMVPGLSRSNQRGALCYIRTIRRWWVKIHNNQKHFADQVGPHVERNRATSPDVADDLRALEGRFAGQSRRDHVSATHGRASTYSRPCSLTHRDERQPRALTNLKRIEASRLQRRVDQLLPDASVRFRASGDPPPVPRPSWLRAAGRRVQHEANDRLVSGSIVPGRTG